MDLRRIDALVAEHVMGEPFLEVCEGCGEKFDGFVPHCDWACALCDYQYGSDPTCPPFSASIEAAWAVVEKLARDEAATTRIDAGEDYIATVGWYGSRHDEFFRGQARASTAPLAICLAALRAKGVEVPS